MLLLSAAVLAGAANRPMAAAALAGPAVLAALATLWAYATGSGLGLDRLIFAEAVALQENRPFLGRMAPGTAVAAMLLGTAILLTQLGGRQARRSGVVLATTALLAGIAAGLGFLFGAEMFQGLGFYSRMAPHSALSVLLLGTAVLALAPDTGWVRLLVGSGPGAATARRLLPMVTIAPLGLAWLFHEGWRAGLYGPDLRITLITLSTLLLLGGVVLWHGRRLDQVGSTLAASEARLAAMVAQAGTGIAQIDLDGRFTFVNDRYCEIFGRARADLLGLGVWDVTHPDDRARNEPLIGRLITAGKRFTIEKRYRRGDGGLVWVSAHVSGVHNADGRITSVMAVVFDLSERKCLEQSLAAERARLQAVLDSVPLGVILAEAPDGRIVLGNRRIEEIMRHPVFYSQDVAAYRQWDARHADGRRLESHEYPLAITLATGEPASREALYRRGDGTMTWLQINSAPVRDDTGQITGAVVAIADIDAQRRATDALAESEARFRNMADNAPVMIWVTDPAGRCTYLSRTWYAFSGQTPETGLGLGWLDATHPNDRAAKEREFHRANTNREPFRLEYRLRRADGEYRWAIDAAAARFSEAGEFLGYVGSIIDITDRKEAETALRESEERLRRVVDGAPFPIMVHAEDGEVVHLSRVWLDLTGYAPEEIAAVGDWIDRAFGRHDGEARAEFDQLFALDRPIDEGEFTIRTADGSARVWTFRSSPIGRDERGRRLVVSMAADLTERKEAEERLRLLMREVDHRAKNALAVVQSIVLLSRAEDPADFAEAVQGRVAAMARAHSLLATARWSGVNLADMVHSELAAYTDTVRVSVDGLPVTITADAAQAVSMVLHELTTNAAKYGAMSTPAGHIAVSWAVDLEAGRLALDWIESGGPHVAPPSRYGFGSMLLQRTIEDQLDGELRLDWDPAGLRCHIVLPRDCFSVSGIIPAAPEARYPVTDRTPPSAAGARVLVVEDESLTALALEDALVEAGFHVLGPVGRVQEAIDLARSMPPDVAVLDVNLFGQPSFPVAEALDAMGVPYLFCTGYANLNGAGEWLRRAPVLTKPVSHEQMTQALHALLASGTRPTTGIAPVQ